MTSNPRTVLVVERPGAFRDALSLAIEAGGGSVHTSDDALDALSRLSLAPDVLLVGDDAGPPGGAATCRIARRKLSSSRVYLLRSEADDTSSPADVLLRGWGTDALAALLLCKPGAIAPGIAGAERAPRECYEVTVPALRVGELLLMLAERSTTGRLSLTTDTVEREVFLLEGLPVFARSSLLSERLGAIGVTNGVLTLEQVELALEHAWSNDCRLGEALVAQKILAAPGVHALLGDQVVAQLAAACEGPQTRARLYDGADWVDRTPILRVHPLTAMLAAVERSSKGAISTLVEELGDRKLVDQGWPREARSWLRDVGAKAPDPWLSGPLTVRQLRDRLLQSVGTDPRVGPQEERGDVTGRRWADVLTVTLLRAGAVRVATATEGKRAGVSDAASAIARAASVTIALPPATPIKEPSSELERHIHAYLHGARPAEIAAMAAVRGPGPESVEPALAPLLALYLRCKSLTRPRAVLGVSDAASGREIRAAFFRLADEADPIAMGEAHGTSLVECRATEIRSKLDAALAEIGPIESSTLEGLAPDPQPEAIEEEDDAEAPAARPKVRKVDEASVKTEEKGGRAALYTDERLGALEPLLQRAEWEAICELLGPPETSNGLRPELGLVYAIARKEAAAKGTDGAQPTGDAEALAIRSVSSLLGVPEQSTVAIVVAKRALRLLPVSWRQRKAPTNPLWIAFIVLVAISIGAAVGFFVSDRLS